MAEIPPEGGGGCIAIPRTIVLQLVISFLGNIIVILKTDFQCPFAIIVAKSISISE